MEEIIALCAQLPLALSIVAARAAARPGSRSRRWLLNCAMRAASGRVYRR